MTRRDLIALLGTAAAAWPVRGSAQQGERARRVGALTNLADHSRMFALLLIVTGATGAIDAVGILHFQTFAAFVTGTIVLLGAEMVGQAHTGVAKPIVLVAFFVGAILGGRLMRRRKPTERLFAESLCVTAALILAVALISAALGIVLTLLLGAAGGATLSAYAVWPGLLLAAALLALAGTLGLRTTTESAPPERAGSFPTARNTSTLRAASSR